MGHERKTMMQRLVMVGFMVGLSSAGWAACTAPWRPACVPVAGEFDDAQDMRACASQLEGFAEHVKMYMACEKDPAKKQALQADIAKLKDDFDAAAKGVPAEVAPRPGSSVSGPQVLPVMIDVNVH